MDDDHRRPLVACARSTKRNTCASVVVRPAHDHRVLHARLCRRVASTRTRVRLRLDGRAIQSNLHQLTKYLARDLVRPLAVGVQHHRQRRSPLLERRTDIIDIASGSRPEIEIEWNVGPRECRAESRWRARRRCTSSPSPPRRQSGRTAGGGPTTRLATAVRPGFRREPPSDRNCAISSSSARFEREPHDAIAQLGERDPRRCRRLRNETRLRHAGKRVRLQAIERAVGCHSEIDSRVAARA